MKSAPRPLPAGLRWLCGIFGVLLILGAVFLTVRLVIAVIAVFHVFLGPKGHAASDQQWMTIFAMLAGRLVGQILLLGLGIWLVKKAMANPTAAETQTGSVPPSASAPAPAVVAPVPVYAAAKSRRWSSCNILHLAPDAKRLWRFDAKGKGFALGLEQRVPHAEPLPGKHIAKSWSSLWSPKLNVAWLPVESAFLRVVELPAANLEETFSMVELQLEKLSPIPVTQIVWTMHVLGTHQNPAKADGTVESLQSVIVVLAERAMVEEFLGRLERDGFQSDRLEVPMLDQLEAVGPKEDSVWVFPLTMGGQNAALVTWWFGGAWRNLSFVTLPAAGDRAAELKSQLSLLAMAGEVEGWLTAQPRWYLVADPVNATEWEQLLRTGLNEPVAVVAPRPPVELAQRSANRAAASVAKVNLQPAEFSERYREQFFDRLWLHGLAFAGVLYAVGLVIYFCGVTWLGYQTRGVEAQVAAISTTYTNAIQIKARLAVLQERSALKFAALDCCQLVAQELPPAVTLQRCSFVDGRKLALSGQVNPDDIQKLSDFYDALRKARPNDKPFFNSGADSGDPLSYHQQGNMVMWNFSLELMQVEAEEK